MKVMRTLSIMKKMTLLHALLAAFILLASMGICMAHDNHPLYDSYIDGVKYTLVNDSEEVWGHVEQDGKVYLHLVMMLGVENGNGYSDLSSFKVRGMWRFKVDLENGRVYTQAREEHTPPFPKEVNLWNEWKDAKAWTSLQNSLAKHGVKWVLEHRPEVIDDIAAHNHSNLSHLRNLDEWNSSSDHTNLSNGEIVSEIGTLEGFSEG